MRQVMRCLVLSVLPFLVLDAPAFAAGLHPPGHDTHFRAVLVADDGHRMPTHEALGPDEDIAFITQLSLIEGHVVVGMQLYQDGEAEMGLSHVQHPVNEIYEAMRPALAKMGLPGFEADIDRLDQAMQARLPNDQIKVAKAALFARVHQLRKQHSDTAKTIASTSAIMQIVAGEYASGVHDGKVIEDYEYQDSWGFKQVAQQMIAALPAADRAAHAADINAIETAMASLDVFWVDLPGRKTVAAPVSAMQAAVNRIVAACQNFR